MGDNGGLRYDGDKTRYDLIPPEWEHALAEVLTAGAKKYAARNWERGMPWSKMVGCARRHLWKFLRGEAYDQETGCHHLAHVAWNVLALMSYHLRGIGEDDLPALTMKVTRAEVTPVPVLRTTIPPGKVYGRSPGKFYHEVPLQAGGDRPSRWQDHPEGHDERAASSAVYPPQLPLASPGVVLDHLLGEAASLREQRKEAQDLLRREAHLATLRSSQPVEPAVGSVDAHDDGA